jgi:subtilisin family serine protease
MKIAVIDSGVCVDHPRLKDCKLSGIGIRVAEGGSVGVVNDFNDETGHGSAICGIIHKKVPALEIVSKG